MLHNCSYFVIDFETGGFSAKTNPITQIGGVVLNSQLEVEDEFEFFVQPYDGKVYAESALNFTKTTMEMINGGVSADYIYQFLKDLVKKHSRQKYAPPVLVGHNWDEFDSQFLAYLFSRKEDSYLKYFSKSTFDTMSLSRLKWGAEEVENHKLGGTCERLGIEIVGAHRALGDAKATALVFIHFAKLLRQSSLQTGEVSRKKSRHGFRF